MKISQVSYVIIFIFGLGLGTILQKHEIPRQVRWMTTSLLEQNRIRQLQAVPREQLQGKKLMVALVFGQSNAANHGESPQAAGENVYTFYRGNVYRARDPLPGATGEGGSVWTRLGDRLLRELDYEAVIFVPIGVGGTAIEQWHPQGNLYPRIRQAIASVQQQQLEITHLLWHQGESDALKKTRKSEYQRLFREMLAAIRAQGVSAPIYVSVATRCGNLEGDEEIQQAQQELVDPQQKIYPGPNTDKLGAPYRYDGCHFSDRGLEKVAELWLQQLQRW